jgi:RimJ/RimL family protein N-acetyltransferase
MSDRERKRLLTRRPRNVDTADLRPYRNGEAAMVAVDPVKHRYAGMVLITLDTCELGGWLAPGYRSQGLGAELFSAAVRFGHEHLGLVDLRAGAELGNEACIGALRSAGFVSVDGPQTHELPDGRIVSTTWFGHRDPAASPCQAAREAAKR